MSADYEVPVIPVNCDQLKNEDVNNILKEVLKQFAVTQIDFLHLNGHRCFLMSIGSKRAYAGGWRGVRRH